MKNVDSFLKFSERLNEEEIAQENGLSKEQINFLDKKTGRTWKYNQTTGLIDADWFNASKERLKDLQGIKFGTIEGNFNVSTNSLLNLDGGPKIVKGDFNVSVNKLTNLIGSPDFVGGTYFVTNNYSLVSVDGVSQDLNNFDAGYCSITSLKGFPKTTKGDFDAFGNKLTSLEGGPTIVGGYYSVGGNPLKSLHGSPSVCNFEFRCDSTDITTFEGGPTKVLHFNSVTCKNLKSLKGAPTVVDGDFNVTGSNLTTLEGSPTIVKGFFKCGYNKLSSLSGGPVSVGAIVLSGNALSPAELLKTTQNNYKLG